MNIQMQTVGVFSAPLVAIAEINFPKADTKLWVITLTMLEINRFFLWLYKWRVNISLSYTSISHKELHWRQLVLGKNTPHFKKRN